MAKMMAKTTTYPVGRANDIAAKLNNEEFGKPDAWLYEVEVVADDPQPLARIATYNEYCVRVGYL